MGIKSSFSVLLQNPKFLGEKNKHEANNWKKKDSGPWRGGKDLLGYNLVCCLSGETNNVERLTLISLKKIFLKIHFLNGKCHFETIKKSFRKYFIAKHCNVSKYLFPFEGVAMPCATLPYSFAPLFLFRLNHFLNVTLAVLVPLKFFFLG